MYNFQLLDIKILTLILEHMTPTKHQLDNANTRNQWHQLVEGFEPMVQQLLELMEYDWPGDGSTRKQFVQKAWYIFYFFTSIGMNTVKRTFRYKCFCLSSIPLEGYISLEMCKILVSF